MTAPADVVVVGGGLAGLSAAVHLHRAGLATVVCEAAMTWAAGSALTAATAFSSTGASRWCCRPTPSSAWQVDLDALRLRPFLRGLLVTTDTERRWLAAPWHGPQAARAPLVPARPSPDSLALAAFSLRDMLAPGPAISRANPGASTLTELRTRVSEATITSVLWPFLAGVFLDPSLGTSARLFHLIWRCFLRGGAALPEGGMGCCRSSWRPASRPAPCGPGRR